MPAIVFSNFNSKHVIMLRPYQLGEDLQKGTIAVNVEPADHAAGSPKPGDWIALDPRNPGVQFLVPQAVFAGFYVPATAVP